MFEYMYIKLQQGMMKTAIKTSTNILTLYFGLNIIVLDNKFLVIYSLSLIG